MPDVSVIVVTWNTREMTLRCLEHLRKAVNGLDAEVFVVDNASSDGTAAAIREKYAEVKLISAERNLGFAGGNNLAIAKAGGRYILLLNSDAMVEPGTVRELLSFMDARGDVGACGAQLLNRDGTRQNSFDNFPTFATELLPKSLLRALFPRRYPSKRQEYREPLEVESVLGTCMMVRAEAMKQAGVLDERFFFLYEETDWCLRMRKAGWRIFFVPSARAMHLQGQTKASKRAAAKIEYYRSLYAYFKKHYGTFASVAFRGLKFFSLCVNLSGLFLGNIFTFFTVPRWRLRLSVYARAFAWHIMLCPGRAGLRGGNT